MQGEDGGMTKAALLEWYMDEVGLAWLNLIQN